MRLNVAIVTSNILSVVWNTMHFPFVTISITLLQVSKLQLFEKVDIVLKT